MKDNIILCAVDFRSPSTARAIQWSINESGFRRERLVVLFCHRLMPSADNDEASVRMLNEQTARQKMAAFVETLDPATPPRFEFVVEIGFYASRIEEYLKKGNVRLLAASQSIFRFAYDADVNRTFDQFVSALPVPIVLFSDRVEQIEINNL